MTATPTSKGKDRTVSSGSEADSAPDAVDVAADSAGEKPESGGGSKKSPSSATGQKSSGSGSPGSSGSSGQKKSTAAAGQKRDEVVVQVPSPADETESDVRVAGASSSSSETRTDIKALPAEDPEWATPAEPGDSVFAGRTDTVAPPPPAAGPVGPAGSVGPVGPAPMGPSGPSPVRPSAPVGGPGPTAVSSSGDGKSPRKAHLQVSRFEPLSVMKFSFVMSLVCFVVLLVAVTVLYVILSGLGVFDSIANTINELTQEQGSKTSSFDASSWFSFTKIFGYTALIGGLNVLIITALATVWSVIYNIAADFVGGVEVTLKEAE